MNELLFAEYYLHVTFVNLRKHCVKDEARKKNRGAALFFYFYFWFSCLLLFESGHPFVEYYSH